MLENKKEQLQSLIIDLDLELNSYTNDSSVYDNCRDALDLISHDAKAKEIYKQIIDLVDFEIPEELKEILQTYDVEIENYFKQIEENNK